MLLGAHLRGREIEVHSQPEDLGSLFVLEAHINLELKYFILSSLLSRVDVKYVVSETNRKTRLSALCGSGVFILKKCAHVHGAKAQCSIVSSNELEIEEVFQ